MNRSYRCGNGGSVHSYCPYADDSAAEKCSTYTPNSETDSSCRFKCATETQLKKVSESSIISHPAHYTEGRKYEPKDVIRDWGLNFNLGSAVKYISRAGRKDDILQDLRKARQFLDFEIDALQKERDIQDIE